MVRKSCIIWRSIVALRRKVGTNLCSAPLSGDWRTDTSMLSSFCGESSCLTSFAALLYCWYAACKTNNCSNIESASIACSRLVPGMRARPWLSVSLVIVRYPSLTETVNSICVGSINTSPMVSMANIFNSGAPFSGGVLSDKNDVKHDSTSAACFLMQESDLCQILAQKAELVFGQAHICVPNTNSPYGRVMTCLHRKFCVFWSKIWVVRWPGWLQSISPALWYDMFPAINARKDILEVSNCPLCIAKEYH